MNRCKCGSYALNDAPETGLCDVCNQKAKVAALTAERDALREKVARMMEWAKALNPESKCWCCEFNGNEEYKCESCTWDSNWQPPAAWGVGE